MRVLKRFLSASLAGRLLLGDFLLVAVIVAGLGYVLHERVEAGDRNSAHRAAEQARAFIEAARSATAKEQILFDDIFDKALEADDVRAARQALVAVSLQARHNVKRLRNFPGVIRNDEIANLESALLQIDQLIRKDFSAVVADRPDPQRLLSARQRAVQLSRKTSSLLLRLQNRIHLRNDATMDEFADEADELIWTALFGAALLLMIVIFRSGYIFRAVVRPASRLASATTSLAEGDLETVIPTMPIAELGAIAVALDQFRETALREHSLQAASARALESEHRAIADREMGAVQALAMQKRLEADRRQTLHNLARRFEESVAGVVAILATAAEQLRLSAQNMAGLVNKASAEAALAATASQQAVKSVQIVVSASEKLTVSIQDISNEVLRQTRLTHAAETVSASGEAAAVELSSKAKNINNFITLIRSIAGQTNLLALNAAIEAARIGVSGSGSGFAVVAAEVKQLSVQTNDSAGEISLCVDDVLGQVGRTTESIRDVARTLAEVRESAATVSTAVRHQSASTTEIARHAHDAASNAENLGYSAQVVSRSINDAGIVSDEVEIAARSLRSQSERLQAEARKFMAELLAA